MLPKRQIEYIYEELGQRIKKFRQAKGYKQAPFAELLKISRASLVNIEQGRQHPPLHNLYEIARLLGVHIKDLLPDLIEVTETELDQKIEKQVEAMSDGNPEVQQKLLEFIKNQNIKSK